MCHRAANGSSSTFSQSAALLLNRSIELLAHNESFRSQCVRLILALDLKVSVTFLCCGIVQELCESRGGRPGLSVLTSLLVSVDVKNY